MVGGSAGRIPGTQTPQKYLPRFTFPVFAGVMQATLPWHATPQNDRNFAADTMQIFICRHFKFRFRFPTRFCKRSNEDCAPDRTLLAYLMRFVKFRAPGAHGATKERTRAGARNFTKRITNATKVLSHVTTRAHEVDVVAGKKWWGAGGPGR